MRSRTTAAPRLRRCWPSSSARRTSWRRRAAAASAAVPGMAALAVLALTHSRCGCAGARHQAADAAADDAREAGQEGRGAAAEPRRGGRGAGPGRRGGPHPGPRLCCVRACLGDLPSHPAVRRPACRGSGCLQCPGSVLTESACKTPWCAPGLPKGGLDAPDREALASAGLALAPYQPTAARQVLQVTRQVGAAGADAARQRCDLWPGRTPGAP